MAGDIRVKEGEICVGKALPWAAYDRNGRLLLQRGETIHSRRQLEILFKRGLYRRAEEHARDDTPLQHAQANPFELLADFRQRTAGLTASFLLGQPEAVERARRLAVDLQNLCAQESDAALGSVHLCKDAPYSVCHPLHTAILCELVGSRCGYDQDTRLSLLCAALTQNLAMSELHDRLRRHAGPLVPEQQAVVDAHPQRSVDMLRQAGVDDEVWLQAVAQHHERLDGSGYPNGLAHDDIAPHARLLGVVDRYTAMVSERAYRPALIAKNALRHFLQDSQSQFDPQFGALLIKALSIFPPGSWVRLANGEVGIVLRRSDHATQPLVGALQNGRGGTYVRPLRRDAAQEKFRVTDVLPERSLPFDLATLWGYQ